METRIPDVSDLMKKKLKRKTSSLLPLFVV
jgi:hypothetical protein